MYVITKDYDNMPDYFKKAQKRKKPYVVAFDYCFMWCVCV